MVSGESRGRTWRQQRDGSPAAHPGSPPAGPGRAAGNVSGKDLLASQGSGRDAYTRLEEPEIAVLEMLDGCTSGEQIQDRLKQRFPSRTTTLPDIEQLIGSLHRSGVLIANRPGQGDTLLARNREGRVARRKAALLNILAIRLPGFDPERLLRALYPLVRWAFHRLALVCGLGLMLAAVLFAGANADALVRRLPDFQVFFAGPNIVLLVGVLILLKTIHELAHGLTCRHFGGECHEIGVMLLVLTPVPYCNTSDAWMLPSKWQRMMIAAAGMYVELLVASACTFVWWCTPPGSAFCLPGRHVHRVGQHRSAQHQPSLAYDGYYILADWLEVPNLTQKARLSLLAVCRTWCLGLPPASDRLLPEKNRWLFAAYSIASFLYRIFILGVILLFLKRLFASWGLESVGYFLCAMAACGIVGARLVRVWKYLRVPGRWSQVNKPRLAATIVICAAALLVIASVPVRRTVVAAAVIRPADASTVYVETAGILRSVRHQSRDHVAQGDVLGVLENPDLDIEIERLQGEIAQTEVQLRSIQQRRREGTAITAAIPSLESALKSLRNQLATQGHQTAITHASGPLRRSHPSTGLCPTATARRVRSGYLERQSAGAAQRRCVARRRRHILPGGAAESIQGPVDRAGGRHRSCESGPAGYCVARRILHSPSEGNHRWYLQAGCDRGAERTFPVGRRPDRGETGRRPWPGAGVRVLPGGGILGGCFRAFAARVTGQSQDPHRSLAAGEPSLGLDTNDALLPLSVNQHRFQ